MLGPGLLAAALCAAGVALSERQALTAAVGHGERKRTPFSAAERHAAAALCVAALAAWAAPFLGVAPWWPFTGAVSLALLAARERPHVIVPWRVGAQVGGLVIVIQALALPTPGTPALGLVGLAALFESANKFDKLDAPWKAIARGPSWCGTSRDQPGRLGRTNGGLDGQCEQSGRRAGGQ